MRKKNFEFDFHQNVIIQNNATQSRTAVLNSMSFEENRIIVKHLKNSIFVF